MLTARPAGVLQRERRLRGRVLLRALAADASIAKQRLVYFVAPLDRGSAARGSDRAQVEKLASELEALQEPEGEASAFPELFSGCWRLLYSSTFAGQSGGSQGFAGAPGAGTPLRLGAVLQGVSPRLQRLDNVVELSLGPLQTGACLRHSMSLDGRIARIALEEVILRPPRGLKGARSITLPSPLQLLGLQSMAEQAFPGASEFKTTFVDETLRISRSGRGELRIFLREGLSADD